MDKYISYNQETEQVNLILNYVNKSNNPNPEYSKSGDSGFDLRANLPEGSVTIEPLSRLLIPTGLYFDIPDQTEIQVRPRSGLALKNGIMIVNSPGTVDSGYTGEVSAILFNSDKNTPFVINHGDRIAQLVLMPVLNKPFVLLKEVEKIEDTERGDSGFGSTGLQ